MHQDKSTRLNLERNLRHSRRHNNDVPEWKDYETTEDDPRPIADPKLEWEADKLSKVHVRNNPGENEVLEGYGTTNFGVSPFEEKKSTGRSGLLLGSGLLAGGLLLWLNRQRIITGIEVLSTYSLLLREERLASARLS